jgi:hypothetical protein
VPHITDDMSQPDAALALAAAGMYVFPVDHPELAQCAGIGQGHNPKTCNQRGKCPVIKWGSGASISEHNIRYWWSGNPRNIGIHCGMSGLVVIDEDVLGAFKHYADEHGYKITPTLVVSTAKGRHYYFVAPADIQLGNEAGALKDYNIDVRAGNAYVVGPGSLHQTGVVYGIEVALPPAALPDWVVQAIKAKTNGHKNNDGVWETVGGDFDRFELPEVIKDHTRDTTLFQYASSLLARELPRGEAEILMRAAWQRCEQPPKAADTYTVEQALGKLDRYEPGRSEGYEKADRDPDTERATFDTLVAKEAAKIRIREAARELVDAHKRPPAEPFDAGTLAEILARPADPAARIEELIPWESSTLTVAQRKVGKTTFMLNACRSLITGQDFLGKFGIRPIDGEIAYLNFEVSAAQLARWAAEVGIPADRFYIVNLRGRRNPFSNAEDQQRLAAILKTRGTEAIFCDPFGRAYTGQSQNDPGEVGAWLINLDNFARAEAGALDLMLATHAGWNGERTRGSSALEDWADSIITMTRDDSKDGDGARYVRAIGRDVDLEEDQLTYDAATRTLALAGTGSRKAAAQKRKAERNADTLRVAITKLVTEQPGINGSEVERGLRNAGVTFQRGEHREVLKALVDEGKFTVEPGKRNAKCYQITQLAQIAQASPEIAHGLASGASPARLYKGGLATNNTGTSDVQRESGLAAPLDHTDNGDAPPPNPVLADGAVQLDLISDLESDAVKGVAPVARTNKRQKVGTCAGCGERMTITEDGQTTHPGCEVTQ